MYTSIIISVIRNTRDGDTHWMLQWQPKEQGCNGKVDWPIAVDIPGQPSQGWFQITYNVGLRLTHRDEVTCFFKQVGLKEKKKEW